MTVSWFQACLIGVVYYLGNIGTPWEPFVIDISGVITGIANVNTGYEPGVWYTLQGIRIGTNKPTTSGVYLYNGQKKVIKKSTN